MALSDHPACAERSERLPDAWKCHPCSGQTSISVGIPLLDVVGTPKAATTTFRSSVDIVLQVGPCETYAVGETGTVSASV